MPLGLLRSRLWLVILGGENGDILKSRYEKYLKLLDTKQPQKEIDKLKLELQKVFLKCFETKIEKARKQTRSNEINL